MVDLTIINSPIAPDYDKYHHSTNIWFAQAYNNSSLDTRNLTGTDMIKVAAQAGPNRQKGSFQCNNHKLGRKCDLCKHMKDKVEFVYSQHFRTKHPVRGHLVHQPRDRPFKDRWFVYLIEDVYCNKQYIGSTTDMYGRWGNHKS